MSKRRATQRPATNRSYPRTARLSQLVREVLGESLERIDDPRLERVAITAVDVDSEMQRAIVYFDSFAGLEVDAETMAAFAAHRVALQRAIGKQVRAKNTPVLEFRPDDVLRSAERIERILREHPIPERPDQSDEDGSS